MGMWEWMLLGQLKASSVPSLRTWKPVHLPPCCLASVWFWVCPRSILLQTRSFSRAETSLVFFVLFSLPCCGPPRGPVSTTRQRAALDSPGCVLWFLPGAPKGAIRTCPRPDLVSPELRMDRSWDFAVKCSIPELYPPDHGIFE